MSKGWTKKELQIASAAMKAAGNIGYEEFCEEIEKSTLPLTVKMLSLSQPSWNLGKRRQGREASEAFFVQLKFIRPSRRCRLSISTEFGTPSAHITGVVIRQ